MALPSGSPSKTSVLLGAAFLMATSAIGPGFITQTTVFTEQLGTSFGFIILCSVLLDIVIQLNIWRVISVSGLRAQDLANRLLPGTGYLLASLVALGGLAFNIGNIAGAALGFQVLFDLELWIGALVSAAIAVFIFWSREAGRTVDTFAKVLGILMIVLTGYVAFSSRPPLLEALHRTFVPEKIDSTAIIVLVGGTVGGYISFAGVHRLLDDGIVGEQNLERVSRSSISAILLASLMRVLLFLAVLGVVMAVALDPGNPAADVFRHASGEAGYRIFGVVLWCASITSIVGSTFTSVSFLKTLHPFFEKRRQETITGFILFSAGIFLFIGRPVNVLVLVGALNGFILPIALAVILIASGRKTLIGNYRHPVWMQVAGWIAVSALLAIMVRTILYDFGDLWE